VRQQRENRVCLHRTRDLDPVDPARGGGKPGGHAVGVGRVAAPQLVVKERIELGRQKAHLGGELQRLLAQVVKPRGQHRVEHHDGLSQHDPVLGAAEREQVHTDVGGERAQRHVKRRRGVGQAGAVDVQEHLSSVGRLRQGRDLVE
jgi:hypothetical protein